MTMLLSQCYSKGQEGGKVDKGEVQYAMKLIQHRLELPFVGQCGVTVEEVTVECANCHIERQASYGIIKDFPDCVEVRPIIICDQCGKSTVGHIVRWYADGHITYKDKEGWHEK